MCSGPVLIGAFLILVVVLAIGAVTLVKLGVLARYALKEDAPDQGDYDLDQSREAGEEQER